MKLRSLFSACEIELKMHKPLFYFSAGRYLKAWRPPRPVLAQDLCSRVYFIYTIRSIDPPREFSGFPARGFQMHLGVRRKVITRVF